MLGSWHRLTTRVRVAGLHRAVPSAALDKKAYFTGFLIRYNIPCPRHAVKSQMAHRPFLWDRGRRQEAQDSLRHAVARGKSVSNRFEPMSAGAGRQVKGSRENGEFHVRLPTGPQAAWPGENKGLRTPAESSNLPDFGSPTLDAGHCALSPSATWKGAKNCLNVNRAIEKIGDRTLYDSVNRMEGFGRPHRLHGRQ